MSKSILLVEDNDKLRRYIKLTLDKEGYDVYEASTGAQAEATINEQMIDVVVLDIHLPDTTGIKLLEKWKTVHSQTQYILCTAYGDVEDAVQAMKIGAFDYLTKPIKADELKVVIERTFEWAQLNQENKQLKDAVKKKYHMHGMIGESKKMQQVFEFIQRISIQDITVLLQGESGTGKSRCAHAIHLESPRRNQPFIPINCAAIPDHLLESELFGYQKGAFTGATQTQKGKFEAADGGTLFLDEIAEISLELQAKLLQVTQEKTFIPLGSTKPKHVDVRIIAATNRDLAEMVQQGEFREDLYYRLNIIGIELPPLRERQEDIPLLITQTLEQLNEEHNRQYTVPKAVLAALSSYPWPGNIRELYNALARAAVLSPDEELRLSDFPEEIKHFAQENQHDATDTLRANPIDDRLPLPKQLQSFEKHAIEGAIQSAEGNQAQAAEQLGISRQSLLYKIRKYKIDIDKLIET
ncbi:sigma-54-dependent transcriptional regulator [Desertibacillus haloalkaliphilus]|uniref:sigma-54-dependent transcriptional regulator n=1 Tax=Desertibacillus haloalkaliphilus TaxID=1328930 RepID=UPI0028AB6F30|nr:sigma-54 dependent transcriptional regulator [Desertibacillus haloalkaliphilus]